MNYYFLLEDEKSFLKVLPKWLKHMKFQCERVADIKSVKKNNYVLQSGQGVTQLVTKVLFETIETILYNPKTIDKLVVILDAEEENAEDRKQEVFSKIEEKYKLDQLDFELRVFVCNHWNETIAKYHFHYLHEMFRYKGMRYNKNRPDLVAGITYFEGLIQRIRDTDHIASFQEFVMFIENENKIMGSGETGR